MPNLDNDQELLLLLNSGVQPNLDNDQELLLLLNSGVQPNLDNDQELIVIVEQRLVPAIIRNDVDQELVIIVQQRVIPPPPTPETLGIFRVDHWLFQANGPVITQAEVWVCSQPAAVSGGYQVTTQQGVTVVTGDVPSPLVQLYGDPNGLSHLSQPLIPDAFGHISFYIVGHGSGNIISAGDFYTLSSYTTVGSRANQLRATLFQTLPDQYAGRSTLLG
jgi:hypothetical protein